MKKVLALVVALVLVLSLGTVAMAEDTIKIGVFEPFSGDNGAGGRQEVLGIEYANTLKPTVEIDGKTYTIELVNADNQSASDKAVTAAQSLVSSGVSIVLGSYGSGASMAGGDVFAAAGIPAIGVSCTNPNVTLLCDYYWRICFLDPFQGSVMANFAAEKGCKKAYVLTMLGEDYGNGLGYYFTDAFEKLGGEVISETFTEGTSDFSAYLNNAVKAGCDVVFAPSAITYASLIVDQAAALNVSFPIMAGDTWENSVVLDAAKGKNVEVYVSTFFAEDDSNADAVAFIDGYKAWLNANSDKLTDNGGNDIVAAVSVLGYDAYNVAIAAIEAAGSADPAAIAEALPSVSVTGITGSIAFDENGDAKKDMAYIKQADGDAGAFVFVKTQSVAELDK